MFAPKINTFPRAFPTTTCNVEVTANDTTAWSSLNHVVPVPVSRSQSRSVLSQELERARRPSGRTATDVTKLLWPSSTRRLSPVSKSQSRSVLPPEPERARRPSGRTATAVTQLLWPSSTRRLSPVSKSQSRSVLSQEPERARRPSGRTATVVAELLWPLNSRKPLTVLWADLSPMPSLEDNKVLVK